MMLLALRLQITQRVVLKQKLEIQGARKNMKSHTQNYRIPIA